MEEVLKKIIDQEKDIAIVGATMVQTEQLLRDLETLDTRAQVTNHNTYTQLQFETWIEGSDRADEK